MNTSTGILLGLGAALFQSLSYLASRRFVTVYRGSTLHLLSLAHMIMGVFALVLLPFVMPRPMPRASQFLGPALVSVIFYLGGQISLFMALRTSHPSRVSPLLGLKILMLALIGPMLLNESPTAIQWIGVVMSVAAAIFLSRSGEKLALAGLAWILAACLCYSLSDIYIKVLVGRFEHLQLIHASLLSVSICYLLSAAAGVAVFPFLAPRVEATLWKGAFPFAVAWFGAIVMLFACFASIGVVFGNVIQSSRGLISIVLGALVASAGHNALERRMSGGILAARVAAALLMAGAIAVFSIGRTL